MQAGLVTGERRIEFPELPTPEPAPGCAVVDIAYCGICGTDLHAYVSGDPYNPAICGHEWTGHVSALGPDVTSVKEGDRVGVGVASACGRCSECEAGDAAHCSGVLAGMLGIGPLAPRHGGFAPAIAIEAARLYGVRKALTDEQAAMLEPAAVAVHAVRRTPLRLGDSVLVLGAGPIGLLTLQCARAAGAGRVVVVEPNGSRASRALALGADVHIDPGAEDVPERARAECGPLGPDVVFECAGIPSTIQQSVDLVRRGGAVSLVGLATGAAEIGPGAWLVKEVRLVASLGYVREEFDVAMQLIEDDRLRTEPLHTSTVGLRELEPAFERLLAGGEEVKILVDPRR